MTSIGLTIAGLALGFRELAPYFASGYSEADRFAVLSGGDYYPGISRFGRDMYLDECTNTGGGAFALFQPVEERTRLIDNCLVQALALQQAAPLDSRVWIVTAELQAAAGRLDEMHSAIERSRQASPGIVPYAIRRLSLLASYDMASRDEAGRLSDLATLFNSDSGRLYLSNLYAGNDDDRALVTELFAKQPLDVQEKFVAALQRNQGGSGA